MNSTYLTSDGCEFQQTFYADPNGQILRVRNLRMRNNPVLWACISLLIYESNMLSSHVVTTKRKDSCSNYHHSLESTQRYDTTGLNLVSAFSSDESARIHHPQIHLDETKDANYDGYYG